jgi:hypothetical protein
MAATGGESMSECGDDTVDLDPVMGRREFSAARCEWLNC